MNKISFSKIAGIILLLLQTYQFTLAAEPRVVKVSAYDDYPLIFQDEV